MKQHIENHPTPLLFVTISGAHLYGFPSPDSDYDLRGVHILPAREVLGLFPVEETVEWSKITEPEGIQIDFVSHDVRKFFELILRKNGLVLENIFSPLIVHTSPEHDELKAIAQTGVTKNHVHHYLGFARSQWDFFQKTHRVKQLLYVYRVLLTGIHLMQTGEIEANLLTLNAKFQLAYVPELVEQKSTGEEKSALTDADFDFYAQEYQRLYHLLESAFEASTLPEDINPDSRNALNDLLVRLRLKNEPLHPVG